MISGRSSRSTAGHAGFSECGDLMGAASSIPVDRHRDAGMNAAYSSMQLGMLVSKQLVVALTELLITESPFPDQ